MMCVPLWESHETGIFRGMKTKAPHHDPVGLDPAAVRAFRKDLGRVIAEVRKGMEMTQEQFASKLGLDQTTVAKAETGIHLWRMETWLRVGEVLHVPFYHLFEQAADRGSAKEQRKGMNRRVEALDEQEVVLVQIWRQLTQEGREILLGRAQACLELYHQEDNVVPLTHAQRPGRIRTAK